MQFRGSYSLSYYSEKARFPGLYDAIVPKCDSFYYYFFLMFLTASAEMTFANSTQQPKNIMIGTKRPGNIANPPYLTSLDTD